MPRAARAKHTSGARNRNGRQVHNLGDILIRTTLQRIRNQIPDGPETALLFAIFEQAVEDYFYPSDTCTADEQRKAGAFLACRLDYLGLLGLDVDWVREQLAKLIERHRDVGDLPTRRKGDDYQLKIPEREAVHA